MKMGYRPGATPRRTGPKNAPPADVDAYLATLRDAGKRAALEALREQIRAIVPDGVEAISYSMPAFKYKGRPLVGFSAAGEHLSFHTMSPAVKARFDSELAGYSTTKEAVHFTPDRPLPNALIERLVRARMAETDAVGEREG
jgi:uncharacterized protein YdhG (YjbR/CyaY superfamily)